MQEDKKNFRENSGKLISKECAKANSLKRYFTGKPCLHGHIAERIVCSSACVKCFNERVRKLSERKRRINGVLPKPPMEETRRVALKNGYKRYWSERPCPYGHVGWRKTKQYNCVECHRQKGLVKDEDRINFFRTPEESKKLRKAREKVKGSRRRAKMNGRHTVAEINQMFVDQDYKCKGCGDCIKEYHERDHIMPIALGGSDNIENIQLLCRPCNSRKGAMHPDEWFKLLGSHPEIFLAG